MTGGLVIRRAVAADAPALFALHRTAFETLGARDYSRAEIDGLMRTGATVDLAMIAEGGLRVAEAGGRIVASGGWTPRGQSHGAPAAPGQATIRSVFTHPEMARRGLARRMMDLVESEAVLLGGARQLVLVATLTGAPVYARMGYADEGGVAIPLPNGATFLGRRMRKVVLEEVAQAA